MTTIACDGKSVAGDGMVSGSGVVHMTDFVKVRRLKNGAIFGWAGSPFHGDEVQAFLNGESDAFDFGDEEFEALILHPNGTCECLSAKGRRYRQTTPCVTGTGGKLALGAMAAGASASLAVEIACRLDQETGGTVTVLFPQAMELEAVA